MICNTLRRSIFGMSKADRRNAISRISALLEKYHQLGTRTNEFSQLARKLSSPLRELEACSLLLQGQRQDLKLEFRPVAKIHREGYNPALACSRLDPCCLDGGDVAKTNRILEERAKSLQLLKRKLHSLEGQYGNRIAKNYSQLDALARALENKNVNDTCEEDCLRHERKTESAASTLDELIPEYRKKVDDAIEMCRKGVGRLLGNLLERVPAETQEFVGNFIRGRAS